MEPSAEVAIRWERLEELFHRASELPEAERAATAREWCGDQPELLSELLEMLAADSSVERLLASTTSGAEQLLNRPEMLETVDPWLGRVLGPFALERELGRGGMGVVYFHQADRAQPQLRPGSAPLQPRTRHAGAAGA
jgi:hypothetical protein